MAKFSTLLVAAIAVVAVAMNSIEAAPSCGAATCAMYCPYGQLSINECKLCRCYEPCEGSTLQCQAGESRGVVEDYKDPDTGDVYYKCECLSVNPQK